MTEAKRLADLLRRLRLRVGQLGIVFKHQDAATTGVPDVSLTYGGKTSWWEAKDATERGIVGTELQRLYMRRLALSGQAWYVIWDQDGCHLVEPKNIYDGGGYTVSYTDSNNQDLVCTILDVHLGVLSA